MSYSFLLTLIFIVSILLILTILIQNPKDGGLSSSLTDQSSSNIGGVEKTNSFLDKTIWTLSTTLLILILISNISISKGSGINQSQLKETIERKVNIDDSFFDSIKKQKDTTIENR